MLVAKKERRQWCPHILRASEVVRYLVERITIVNSLILPHLPKN
jgi:hypothetical protein